MRGENYRVQRACLSCKHARCTFDYDVDQPTYCGLLTDEQSADNVVAEYGICDDWEDNDA